MNGRTARRRTTAPRQESRLSSDLVAFLAVLGFNLALAFAVIFSTDAYPPAILGAAGAATAVEFGTWAKFRRPRDAGIRTGRLGGHLKYKRRGVDFQLTLGESAPDSGTAASRTSP
ncbi:hypothetical protein GCM10018779_23490 [Streptomyces griseocarneus]|nr:hypothetical protein GCM10018779_23490 [Streptomyces griseocarneus]